MKVNTKTLTTTREGIPMPLIGLSADTLRNLQTALNPVPTEFKDIEYWDEADVTPALTDTQVYDGTETFNVDALTKTVKVTKGIREKTTQELTDEFNTAVQSAVVFFENYTTEYIQGKVNEYNVTNGLAFKDIDAFTKYAVLTSSLHNTIAIRFITYADNIWGAMRTYQSTLTAIPTEAEVKTVLDSVVF